MSVSSRVIVGRASESIGIVKACVVVGIALPRMRKRCRACLRFECARVRRQNQRPQPPLFVRCFVGFVT